MNEIKHYRCPKCGKTSSGIRVIPTCKCTGSSTRTQMEEIKREKK